jgi:hypothetical protein
MEDNSPGSGRAAATPGTTAQIFSPLSSSGGEGRGEEAGGNSIGDNDASNVLRLAAVGLIAPRQLL